jgi:small subunit ribosomal protein S5
MDPVVNNKTDNNVAAAPVKPVASPVVGARPFVARPAFPGAQGGVRGPRPFGTFGARQGGGMGGDRSKNPRKSFSGRGERVKPEFDQKILNIRRVTRVTKGGKRLSFSVTTVAGNRKGSVGVGTGKAGDTSLAIDKAYRSAKKNMITLSLTKSMSIAHDVMAKYCSGNVLITPAPGRGLSAGSAVRSVLDLAGIKDVTAKIISPSKNKLNIARATICALSIFDKRKFTAPVTVSKKEAVAEKKEVKTEVKKEIKK